jgi:hypothetical protein
MTQTHELVRSLLTLSRARALSVARSLSFSLSLSLSQSLFFQTYTKKETWDVDGELDLQEQTSSPHDTYTRPKLLVYASLSY